jgi:hypothetical protein
MTYGKQKKSNVCVCVCVCVCVYRHNIRKTWCMRSKWGAINLWYMYIHTYTYMCARQGLHDAWEAKDKQESASAAKHWAILCMYVYVYIYIYIYIWIINRIYILIYVHVHIRTYAHISSWRAATLRKPRMCCPCPHFYPDISILINCMCVYVRITHRQTNRHTHRHTRSSNWG